MAKFTPKTIQNLDNPPTVVSQINYNFETLQILIDTLLSRDGATPNAMQSNLDMNGNRILNLPVPISPTEPARHGDIQQYVDQAREWAEYSEEQADRAELEAEAAEASAEEALGYLDDLKTRYLGPYATAPTTDHTGAPLGVGALYFNTTENVIYAFALNDIHNEGDPVVVGDDQVIVGYWLPLPVTEFSKLNDVDISTAVTGSFLIWNGLQVAPITLNAGLVPQSNTTYPGGTVQSALNDILNRTSLGAYDISFFASGLLENNEQAFRMVATRVFTIPVGVADSRARSRIAANASSVISLRKNGVVFGTVTFAATSTTGVFAAAGETIFNPGDVLSITAPALADTALRDLAITLTCRR